MRLRERDEEFRERQQMYIPIMILNEVRSSGLSEITHQLCHGVFIGLRELSMSVFSLNKKENHKPMGSPQVADRPAITVWPLRTLVLECKDEGPTARSRNRECAQWFLNLW